MELDVQPGILTLDQLTVKVDTPGIILVPIAVEHKDLDKYGGDAISFGYPIDEGMCTIVTYEEVHGSLAEDTIALMEQHRKDKLDAQKRKVAFSDYLQISQVTEEEWSAGLDRAWITTANEYADDTLDSITYYNWSKQFRDAYDTYVDKLRFTDRRDFILVDDFMYSLFNTSDPGRLLAIREKSPTWWNVCINDHRALRELKTALERSMRRRESVHIQAKIIQGNIDAIKAIATSDNN